MGIPVLGSNTADDAYDVSNSLMLDRNDDSDLVQTFGSAGNRRTFTWSGWIKRQGLGVRQTIFHQYNALDNNQWIEFRFEDTDQITFSWYSQGVFTTLERFRDPHAWYHLVIAVDTTQGTDTNRVKFYVNGNQITLNSPTLPAQDYDTGMNQNSAHAIGHLENNGNFNADYYIAEVFSIDGTQHLPTAFGEFNTNGVWVPIDAKDDLTFGTNGYYLEFKQTGTSQNSSGIGADTSGNDKHFAVTNIDSLHVFEDTCTNNYMTMTRLSTNSRGTFDQGDLRVQTDVQGSVPYGQVEFGWFAVNKGKWYFEAKPTTVGSGGQLAIGWNERWEDGGYTNGHNNLGSNGNAWYGSGGNIKIGSATTQTGPDSYTDNDIIGVAIDLDNDKIHFHKNGSYQRSSDPANNTGGDSLSSSYNNYWTPWMSKDDTSNNSTVEFNFGNPTFTVSSSEADDNGIGNFEYDVPAGYFSICSKNIAEFG